MIQCQACELLHTDPLSCPDCDYVVQSEARSEEYRQWRDRQNESKRQSRRRKKEAMSQ